MVMILVFDIRRKQKQLNSIRTHMDDELGQRARSNHQMNTIKDSNRMTNVFLTCSYSMRRHSALHSKKMVTDDSLLTVRQSVISCFQMLCYLFNFFRNFHSEPYQLNDFHPLSFSETSIRH